jgi:hypothetical protein
MFSQAPAAARLVPFLLLIETACPVRRSIADLPLQRHAMPGFEIELPSGEAKSRGTEYNTGRLRIVHVGGVKGLAQVYWRPGGLDNDEGIDADVKILTAELGGTVRVVRKDLTVAVPESAATRSWLLETSTGTALGTEVGCGARRVDILTSSWHDGVAALHGRIVASFRCRPNPALEKSIGDIPVVFGVGAGWFRQRTHTHTVQLTNGKNLLLASTIGGADHSADDLVRLFKSSGGVPNVHIAERAGDHWPLTMEVDGERHEGWLDLRSCPEHQLTLTLMWVTLKHEDLNSGLQTLRGVRCRRGDEPAEIWLDVPAKSSRPSAPH